MKYPAIQRPDGRLYHPRKIKAEFFYDDGLEAGVFVWGTHDINRARRLADQLVWSYDASIVAVNPIPTWKYRYISYGNIVYYDDVSAGRPCVEFGELVETGFVKANEEYEPGAKAKHSYLTSEAAQAISLNAILLGVP
jgi:hypothetical protein